MLFLTGLAVLSTCAHNKPAPKPKACDCATITLRTALDTNGGKPFYIIVRSVSESEFLQDDYKSIAADAFPRGKDEKVLAHVFSYPGMEHSVVVDLTEGEGLGVYALFTRPGDPWKVLLSPPHNTHYVLDVLQRTIELTPPEESTAVAP